MFLRYKIYAVFVVILLSGIVFAQSKDPNNPTPITSNTFEGKMGSEGGTFYYSYVAPKGGLKVTVTGQTNEYTSPIRVNVYKKVGGDSLGEIYVIADKKTKTESKSYSFLAKQTIILSVRLEEDSTLKWQKFTVSLAPTGGKIIIPGKTGQIIIPGKTGQILIPGKKGLPNLTVTEYQFVPSNNKGLRIKVENTGNTASSASTLQLTVRKINGNAVGRTLSVDVPVISAGGFKWISVNTVKILPKSVSLSDTTFKLIADFAETVTESNESDNEKWHNLD